MIIFARVAIKYKERRSNNIIYTFYSMEFSVTGLRIRNYFHISDLFGDRRWNDVYEAPCGIYRILVCRKYKPIGDTQLIWIFFHG